MITLMNDFLSKHISVQLKPQPTLKMALEVKKIVIEEIVRRELMTRETGCEVTKTDQQMISRLTNEQKLTGEEIVQQVLKSPRQPF